MKKLIISIAIAFLFFSCGEPDSYNMTFSEFKQAYSDTLKVVVSETTREYLSETIKGDVSKNELDETMKEELNDKVEDITGISMDEFTKATDNWEDAKDAGVDGYEKMTMKELLDYQPEK